MELVDENTIGVVGILGSTYTGEYEPIQRAQRRHRGAQRQARLGRRAARGRRQRRLRRPLHPAGAGLGFPPSGRHAPSTPPGHKYGLVYPGVGWVIWRSEEDLPDELIFHVNYLGGDQPTFNLNFSRGAGQVLAQYYNFLRLGRKGYTEIMQGLDATTVLPGPSGRERGPFRDPEQAGDGTAGLFPPGPGTVGDAGGRTGTGLHRVRHLGPPAGTRLDSAGLHSGAQRPGHRCAAGGRPGKLLPGHGRSPGRRPAPHRAASGATALSTRRPSGRPPDSAPGHRRPLRRRAGHQPTAPGRPRHACRPDARHQRPRAGTPERSVSARFAPGAGPAGR